VFLYVWLPDEVETTPLLAAVLDSGKHLVLPRIQTETHTMDLVYVDDLSCLSAGFNGIKEPQDGTLAGLKDIDLAIVPGRAFTESGHRLGRGGGFYDEFLKNEDFRGISLALAFEVQLKDTIPMDPQDQRVDTIITEQRSIECS